ncbi:hypothetical protein [Acinetobacter guillouiae]
MSNRFTQLGRISFIEVGTNRTEACITGSVEHSLLNNRVLLQCIAERDGL